MPYYDFSADGDQEDTDTRLTNAEVEISTDRVFLHQLDVHNPNGSVVYVKFWNDEAADVAVATDEPHKTVAVPANGDRLIDLRGQPFSRGLVMAATTEAGAGDTAPTTALTGCLYYEV